MPESFQYHRPLRPNEVLVVLEDASEIPQYADLPKRITEAGRQYGFNFAQGMKNLRLSGERNTYLVRHLIHVVNESNLHSLSKMLDVSLELYDTVTLATCYWSKEEFLAAGKDVQLLKKRFNGRVNFLMPTFSDRHSAWLPSVEKLVDNAICDTVRIKYHPICISENVSDLVGTYAPFFKAASDLYQRYHLYHRSSTDGFFALRCRDREGFLITSTKTNKNELDMSRVSWVHEYDPATNRLLYSGNYLPSSDSVEAATVFRELQNVMAIIHTHASRLFTRNDMYSSRVLVPPARYGERVLGEQVVAALRTQGTDDFIIMEDHGEVFTSTEVMSLESPVKAFAKYCQEAEDQLITRKAF